VCANRKHKRQSKKPKSSSNVVSLVSYQWAADAEDDSQSVTTAPVFGPFLPSQHSTRKHAPQCQGSLAEQKTPSVESTEKPVGKSEAARNDEGLDDMKQLKALHKKFQKRKTAPSNDPDSLERSVILSDKDRASMSSEALKPMQNSTKVAASTVVTCVDVANRRFGGDVDQTLMPSSELDDVEDIDQQLDMALERHQVTRLHLVVMLSLALCGHFCVINGFLTLSPFHCFFLNYCSCLLLFLSLLKHFCIVRVCDWYNK